MLSWVGALPAHVRLNNRRIQTGSEFTEGVILALAKISPVARYDHLMHLSTLEREQYQWWQHLCPSQHSIEGRLVLFEIQSLFALANPVPVQQ